MIFEKISFQKLKIVFGRYSVIMSDAQIKANDHGMLC